jgi:hypothetical protein
VESRVSWEVSTALRRFAWLLHADNVLAKARHLARVVKANFDPNQPRVPRGNPDGGQWTPGGGGGGRVRLAQNIPPEEERDFEDGNPASEAELAAIEVERLELMRRVREIDPTWNPKESLFDPNHIEGQIAAARGERDEAEARLRELGQSPEDLAADFRQIERDLFGNELLSPDHDVVSVCRVDGLPSIGVNSDAPGSAYTPEDFSRAMGMRTVIRQDEPDIGSPHNLGQMPLNALFHAETTSLLRAAKENGGTLEGKEVDVYVDGEICNNCDSILPHVVRRLGNPTVRFTDRTGYVGTIRNGDWDSGK